MKLTLLEQIKRMSQALKNYTDTAISAVTKATLGLGNVENKTSATIRGELTKANVTTALGYTPPTSNEVNNSISSHNTSTSSHNDIRNLITGLTTRLNALADSDDATLDQMSEFVAYVKANRTLIESITTSKVNVSDIIDNLTTNVSNKPLSAAQGVVLKSLIETQETELLTAIDEAKIEPVSELPESGTEGQIVLLLNS